MIYIFLPVHNEEKTVKTTIEKLQMLFPPTEKIATIIFIDDHCTDMTIDIVGFYKDINVIKNHGLPGKGSAIRYALKNSLFKNMADIIVLLDGDGQIQPYDIITGLKMIDRYCCSVAIGNKRHKYSLLRYGIFRRVTSKAYNILVNILFKINLDDTQCGLKLIRSHCLLEILPKLSVNGFAYDIEMLIALKSVDMRIVDFPIEMTKQHNKGSVNIKNIFETFFDTIKVFIRFKKGIYNKHFSCYNKEL